MDTSDLKRLILRGIIVGAIAGLSIRFVAKDSSGGIWIEMLPAVGILCGAIFSWRIGKELMKPDEFNKDSDEADKEH